MTLTLRSETLEVTVNPERGADITQILDLATGIATLAVSPTGGSTTPRLPGTDSMTGWLNGYPGGWQMLTPNAGPERVHDGVLLGYHGESAISRWRVLTQTGSAATFAAQLVTVPLALHRSIEVNGSRVTVTDTIRNRSEDEVAFRLLQHPAFGAPFLDERAYLVTDAGTIITDAQAPGSLAEADVAAPPTEVLAAGPIPGSLALPGPNARESLFAGLTDFPTAAPSALFASPTHGFGMRLAWERETYPMAWFWIEANHGTGFPWFRRMYAAAVEPANTLPGEGTASNGTVRGGSGTTLPGTAELTSTVTIERVPLGARAIPSTA